MSKLRVEACDFLKKNVQQKFYKKHPDLLPNDVYLQLGRKVKADDFDKSISNKLVVVIGDLKEKFVNIKDKIC